jgi:Copper binding periplasmic protein CusF
MRLRLTLFAVVLLIVPTLVSAHGGHKHVSGTVVSADKTAIVVKTSAGNVSVPVSSTTKYYHGSDTKLPATASEVESGMRVVVHLGGDGKAVEVHIPSPPEKIGVLEGRIVSRDAATNELTVQHGEVKGVMGAMTMGYEVRGQKVDALPKDGSKITAKMHESGGKHWLTDVGAR